jgi:hypothetical protein
MRKKHTNRFGVIIDPSRVDWLKFSSGKLHLSGAIAVPARLREAEGCYEGSWGQSDAPAMWQR